jgi:hypothetical protein
MSDTLTLPAAPDPSHGTQIEWNSVKALLENWRPVLVARAASHRKSSKVRRTSAWLLGASAVILTTLVSGATAFAQATQIGSGLALLSLMATIVTSVSSFLRLGERAERHITLANQCHSLVVEIDFLLAAPTTGDRLRAEVNSIKDRVTALGVDD